jgi:hypothetical protein
LANEADVESTGHSTPVPIAEIPESQQPAHAAPLRNEEMPESRQSAASEIVQDETNGVLTEPFVKTRALRAAVLRKPYVIGTAVLMLSIAGWYVFGRPAAEPASGIFAIRIPISCGTSEQKQFSEEVLRKIRALPGVVSAAITDLLPATAAETEFFQGEEQTQSCQGQARLVSPEYFSTMRMRLLQGRDFTSTDDSSKPMVVVISESMARLCFSGVNPIGRRLTNASSGFKPLVVGVVGDPQPSPPNPLFYIPQSQRTSGSARCGVDLLVRTPDMSRVNQVKLEQSIRGQLLPSAGGATIWNVGGQSRD